MCRVLSLVMGAAAVVLLMPGVAALAQDKQLKKAPKTQACNALKAQATCEGRADCQWVAAVVDAKTGKQLRIAYCRAKPAPPAKK